MADPAPDWSAYIKTGRQFYASRPQPPGRWRKRARAVICEVLDANANVDTIIGLVDAAYPFGPRAHAPYKAWLTERRILIGDLLGPVPPTKDEAEAIGVAHDMAERDRRIDDVLDMSDERRAEILAWLDEHAPHRLDRPCGACGVKNGQPCRDADVSAYALHSPFDDNLRHSYQNTTYIDRLIPHAARYQP